MAARTAGGRRHQPLDLHVDGHGDELMLLDDPDHVLDREGRNQDLALRRQVQRGKQQIEAAADGKAGHGVAAGRPTLFELLLQGLRDRGDKTTGHSGQDVRPANVETASLATSRAPAVAP